MTIRADTLVLGWGNPGRGDDGLGPELVRRIQAEGLPGVEAETAYQLQVEDAAEVARFRRVVFVDADRRQADPFLFEPLHPEGGRLRFSTHSVSPATILALARELFGAEPEAWILGIRGHEFDEFREQLSARAAANLDQALEFLQSTLRATGGWELRSPRVTSTIANHHEGDQCQTTNP